MLRCGLCLCFQKYLPYLTMDFFVTPWHQLIVSKEVTSTISESAQSALQVKNIQRHLPRYEAIRPLDKPASVRLVFCQFTGLATCAAAVSHPKPWSSAAMRPSAALWCHYYDLLLSKCENFCLATWISGKPREGWTQISVQFQGALAAHLAFLHEGGIRVLQPPAENENLHSTSASRCLQVLK